MQLLGDEPQLVGGVVAEVYELTAGQQPLVMLQSGHIGAVCSSSGAYDGGAASACHIVVIALVSVPCSVSRMVHMLLGNQGETRDSSLDGNMH